MYKKVFLIVLRKFHRKIPVLESLWARTQVLYCEIYNIFKNTYFEEHLQKTASVRYICYIS